MAIHLPLTRHNISLSNIQKNSIKLNKKIMGLIWQIFPLKTTYNQYISFTADLEEAKLDTGESLSKFKIISVTRELLA